MTTTTTTATLAGRALAAKRKTHRGGRTPKPTHCARCGTLCPSWTKAQDHCKPEKKETTYA